MELYNYIKSLHLIFVITWFAGLFYIVRLFVYHAEAKQKPQPEQDILIKQYQLMQYRLWYIITWPSAILASVFAFWMLFFTEVGKVWLTQPWMHVKLAFVFLLYFYHLKCHQIFKQLQSNNVKHSSSFFRLWNEGATIILFAVVFLVILKNAINWIFGVVGIIAFSILLMLGYKLYKKLEKITKANALAQLMERIFNFKNLSLRVRIFLSMIFLTLIASVLIAAVSIYQFRKEAREYHQDRLERKEMAIAEHINYVLQTTTYPLTTENIPLIFKEKIFELADIHSMEINFFDLKGKLLISSKAIFKLDKDKPKINPSTLKIIQSSLDKRYVEFSKIDGQPFRSSYTYLKDTKFKPLGILNLPYEENTEFYDNEVSNFLLRFGQVYTFMFFISIVLSYFLSSYITKSLKIISDKMQETQLNQRNEKIVIEDGSKEINLLIKSYNNMVDKLEESATILAQSEREQAWREMAKQVAHEIKNPLTPMRLTVQSFQRKFDTNDPDISKKLDDYTKTILQQIDTMSSVANAFSNFATMPAQQNETLNVVNVVKMALEIFNEDFIQFSALEDEIIAKLDKTQLIRVITNLVKNAIQAIPDEQENKLVFVTVFRQDNEVKIAVKDNGKGISEENLERVFEPKFTTKSSGMGLGLAIIKNIIENYQGTITFETEPNVGTEFLVSFPINK